MARYISESDLMEDLLNRVLDATESDASSGLAMCKAQAQRVVKYREEQEKKQVEKQASGVATVPGVV